MGVPAFFRWLTRKYPSVVIECIEEQSFDKDGQKTQIDASKKNPNGVEFDNFYIDMNGIIHPCTHPENKPAPANENEMMEAIFECIDRLLKIVRPRKLLYMAIDGVAPRAKMNQQRSRRFRAAKESKEKVDQIALIRAQLEAKGLRLPPEKEKTEHFDSNCITPGTEFMSKLTDSLNFYIHDRLMNDPGWKGLKVILSDASVPGEGEHKIMDFIRRQRGLPSFDPNTHHCLCGADADLIMLGLATHELNFTIIREEFIMNQPKRCEICAQTGHEMKECKGLPNPYDDPMEITGLPPTQNKFIFVRLNVLREYLEEELKMSSLPFNYSFERALDDWIFMCFFVGNDFLPHLPSLEIREGAIDRLVNLYKKNLFRLGGFLTDSGDINLDRVQIILSDLGALEDEIFKKRQKQDVYFRMRNRHRKVQEKMNSEPYHHKPESEIIAEVEKEDPDPVDEVRLWEDGYKNRYYKLKFDLPPDESKLRHKIGMEYALGLCWVLKYYYQGCASWNWYFPFHYAPFASDIVNISSYNMEFQRNTKPFSPLEQLMGVFPAASSSLVPHICADLMMNPESPIADFYPIDFMIDLNGKKFAWQGVALLPFVDETRLKKGLEPVYPFLNKEEIKRNTKGHDRLYLAPATDCYDFIASLDKSNTSANNLKKLNSIGVCGQVFVKSGEFFQGPTVWSPIPGMPAVNHNKTYCVSFCDPEYPENFKFMAQKLAGAKDPPKTIRKQGDESNRRDHPRPLIGMVPRNDRAFLDPSGHRALRHNLTADIAVPLGPGRRFDNWQRGNGQRNRGETTESDHQRGPLYSNLNRGSGYYSNKDTPANRSNVSSQSQPSSGNMRGGRSAMYQRVRYGSNPPLSSYGVSNYQRPRNSVRGGNGPSRNARNASSTSLSGRR